MPMSFFTNSGNSYGSAIPFQRIVEPAQLGMFLNLEQAELLRVQRYNEHWRFYYGKQWIHDREDADPLVTINYSKFIVEKGVSWLVKNGFDTEVPEATKHVVSPFLDEVWRYNEKMQFLYLMAQTGGVTGDSFILVTYEEPTEMAMRRNPNSQGSIKIDLLGSEQVYPSWDPLNIKTLTAVRIETIYYEDRNQLTKVDRDDKANHQGRTLNVKRFTQIITPDYIIEQFEGGDPRVRRNILGEIMVVHIANTGLAREFYGMSDLDGLIDLQRELNEKSTDVSDVINYHAQPTTVIQGAKASHLERGPKQIWSGLPVDAKVFNLGLDSDLSASMNWVAFVKKSMLEIAEIPEIVVETPPISNTSGVALHLMYQPIVDKTKRKIPFYESGLERINYLILRIAQVLGMINLPYDLCSQCGGRIVEVLDETGHVPRTVRRCFMINKEDFTFMSPEQVRVKYIRQHSFGDQVTEAPYGQVLDEHKQRSASYWDPETQIGQQEHEDKRRAEDDAQTNAQRAAEAPQTAPASAAGGETAGRPPAKPKALETPSKEAEPPKLAGDIDLPAEPEDVVVSFVYTDPSTGARTAIDRKQLKLVPTGCCNSQYLDPFQTKVTLKDALPRDYVLDYALFREMQLGGTVSKKWVRRKMRNIEPSEYEQIDQELEEEAAERTSVASAETLAAEGGMESDELVRAMKQPAGHNTKSQKEMGV